MEVWKIVPAQYGPYFCSSDGRVSRDEHFLRTYVRPNGYIRVQLMMAKPGFRNPPMHRLIYETFVGTIPKGKEINHKNGIKADNRIENLEVVTRSENCAHAYRVLGREKLHGNKNPAAKLCEDVVREMRWLFAMGARQIDLAREYAVSATQICDIVNNRSWKHI